MAFESRERIETGRREIPISENGDIGHETRVFYSDGSWTGKGSIQEGPNAGKKWVKGHGGNIEGVDASKLGIDGVIEHTETNDWGYMVQGGNTEGQPKTGDSWTKPVAHYESEIPAEHSDTDLVLREGVNQETDEHGRPTYEVKTYGEKVIVMRRTFHDAEGYYVETGKHVAGPEKGKAWEARRPIGNGTIASEAAVMTPLGTMKGLEMRGVVIDRELSEAEASQMTPEQQAETRERMRKSAMVEHRANTWEAAPVEA